jgi:hypothetical protein
MPPRQRKASLCNKVKGSRNSCGEAPPPSPSSPPPPPPFASHPPPPMPDMAKFRAYLVQFMMGTMTSWMAARPRQGERHETIGHTLPSTCGHDLYVLDRGAGPSTTDYLSEKRSLPLRALASFLPNKQSSGCGSRL